ncbi:MAG: efflux RND transporter periplasmic adaptor subunit [Gammaproteobacteria bacterium]
MLYTLALVSTPTIPKDVSSERATTNTAAHVQVLTVERREWRVPILATGSLYAAQTSNVGALVEGVIERVFVHVGMSVRKGQPLFQTRRAAFESRAAEGRAAVAVAKARLTESRNAELRASSVYRKGLLSAADFDAATARRSVTEAEYQRTLAAQAVIERELNDTIVPAPYDGVITARFIDEGVYVSNRAPAGESNAVVQIQQVDSLVAVLHVPESPLATVRIGDAAKIYIAATATPLAATVDVINAKIDANSRVGELRMLVPNPERKLRPGQFLRAELTGAPLELIAVPRSAVTEEGGKPGVMTVRDGVVRRMGIEVTTLNETLVKVISGLEPGAIIVAEPRKVQDGMRIR